MNFEFYFILHPSFHPPETILSLHEQPPEWLWLNRMNGIVSLRFLASCSCLRFKYNSKVNKIPLSSTESKVDYHKRRDKLERHHRITVIVVNYL